MSRFVFVNLVAGFVAFAIGFGDIAGIPGQAIFVSRLIAGICLLLVVAYSLSQAPTSADRKPARRDHRLTPRHLR